MTTLTHDRIDKLINSNQKICISIYLPTHRYGQEVAQGQDAIVLKNHLKEVENKLEGRDLSIREKDELLQPAYDLLDDVPFWNHQKNGLALFLSENGMEIVKLEENPGSHSTVSGRFYIVPLVTQIQTGKNYLILTLNIQKIKLLRADKYRIEDHSPSIESFPPSFGDVVGHDYEPATLQFRGQQDARGNAMYHGHGNLDIDHKKEVLEYFRQINKDLLSHLRDLDLPLILIGQEYLLPIYREVNQYQNLTAESVNIHPANMSDDEIRTKTWDKIQPIVLKEERELIQKLEEWQGTEKTSSDIKEIIESAYQGRIEGLFVNPEEQLYGHFDPDNGQVSVSENENGESLINLAAIFTHQKGGKVFTLEANDDARPMKPIQGLLRF